MRGREPMAAATYRDRAARQPVTAVTLRPPKWAGKPPVPLTPLIGRDEQSAQLQALRQCEEVRLVTLTGPGGVGKTRLALDVATKADLQFDTVGFVALAALHDPELVPVTIARALNIDTSDESTASALQAYFRPRTMLLVLDSVEHLVAAGPGLVGLLGSAPRLTMLVTSRALLRVSGEHVATVAPLALPDPGSTLTVNDLDRFSAVRLFVDRCAEGSPGFTLNDDVLADVAEICRRLDGLPLAIELAAARASVLPPDALLARLKLRLPLLTGGARDQPARLRTMRAGIAWSHDLLSAAEQRLFRRLAIFAGGCTLDAVDAVTALPSDALDAVSGLVDKSLLTRVPSSADQPRFVMLETIREYAMEQLQQSGEEIETRRAHPCSSPASPKRLSRRSVDQLNSGGGMCSSRSWTTFVRHSPGPSVSPRMRRSWRSDCGSSGHSGTSGSSGA